MFNKTLIAATIFAANAYAENLLSAESIAEKDNKKLRSSTTQYRKDYDTMQENNNSHGGLTILQKFKPNGFAM